MKNKSVYEKEIKRGVWLYDNKVPVNVIVFETNLMPGSGDYEDPESIREDKWGVFFGVKHSSTLNPNDYTPGFGRLSTLEEAISDAEKSYPGINWESAK